MMGREIHLRITVQLSVGDMFAMLLRTAVYRVKKDFETDVLIQRDAINSRSQRISRKGNSGIALRRVF
jgi:hypothetical protein